MRFMQYRLPAALDQIQRVLAIPAKKTETKLVKHLTEEEMQAIIKHKELAPFFTGVFGSPRNKSDIVRKVLREHAFSPSCCLFIGDALADLKAAKDNDLAFLGIVPPGKASIFPQEVVIAPDPGHQRWPQLLDPGFTVA